MAQAIAEQSGAFKCPASGPSDSTTDTNKSEKKSVATLLVDWALSTGVHLFHNAEHKAFATISTGGHLETWDVRSAGFKRWLAGLVFD